MLPLGCYPPIHNCSMRLALVFLSISIQPVVNEREEQSEKTVTEVFRM